MIDTRKLIHSIRSLNSFIKENAEQGSTFENQAMFSVLVRDYSREVKTAIDAGMSSKEVYELLKEENRGMGKYYEFVGDLKKSLLSTLEEMVILN